MNYLEYQVADNDHFAVDLSTICRRIYCVHASG